MAISNDPQKDFEEVLDNAGIPVTEEEVKTIFNQEVEDQGSLINNDSLFSPFWRLIETMVTKAYFWLLEFLVTVVLPQSFVKTATGAFLDLYLWSVNLTRKEAVKAQGNVIFERDVTAPVTTLPAGFTISTDRINGEIYKLLVKNETTLPAGVASVSVECEAENTGEAYNLAGGYYQIPQSPLPGLIRAYNPNDWLTTPGAQEESNEDARNRYRAQYQSVSGFYVDDKYKLIMSEFGGVKTDQIYIEHGAPRGPGSANAYILLDSGVPSEPFLNAINKAVRDDGYHGLGDDMMAFALPEVMQSITFEVLPVPNLKDSEKAALMSNIEQFIRCAFRENQAYSNVTLTWPQALFSYSTLNQELRNEFKNIESLYTPNRDLRTGLEIARIDTLTITETARSGS